MARDPKRIKEILNSIEAIWQKYPDFRLGQLVENARMTKIENNPTCDLYYLEDTAMLEKLEKLKEALAIVNTNNTNNIK